MLFPFFVFFFLSFQFCIRIPNCDLNRATSQQITYFSELMFNAHSFTDNTQFLFKGELGKNIVILLNNQKVKNPQDQIEFYQKEEEMENGDKETGYQVEKPYK